MGHRNEVINAVRISILNQPIVETNVSKSLIQTYVKNQSLLFKRYNQAVLTHLKVILIATGMKWSHLFLR